MWLTYTLCTCSVSHAWGRWGFDVDFCLDLPCEHGGQDREDDGRPERQGRQALGRVQEPRVEHEEAR